jgi:hypothetical protein
MQLACRSRYPAAWKRAHWPSLPQFLALRLNVGQNTVPDHKSGSFALLFHDRAPTQAYCPPIVPHWVPAMPERDLHLPAFNGGGIRSLSTLQIPKLIVTFD